MDHVASRMEQWREELPDVDTVGMAILGRLRWITLRARPEIEDVFTRHGLDTGEFDVVSTLLRAGAPYRLRPTELYTSLMISSGGLTSRLDRLAAKGWIRRIVSTTDKRSLMVELTPQGRKQTEAAFREDMAIEHRLVSLLSKNEQRSLAQLLERFATALAKVEA